MEGWIKLHRKILDHWIFSDSCYFRAWIIILFTVNFEDKKVLVNSQIIECKRGQALLSLENWSDLFGHSKKAGSWTIQKVRTFFDLLEKDLMIKKENLIKTTRITVCNYDIYQDYQQPNNNQTTTKQQPNNNQITTTKERKERKELKNDKNINPDSFLLINFCKPFFEEKYLNGKTSKTFETLLKEYSIEQIKDAIKKAKTDQFWTNQFLSPCKLTNTNKDGVKYIDVFIKLKQKLINPNWVTQKGIQAAMEDPDANHF